MEGAIVQLLGLKHFQYVKVLYLSFLNAHFSENASQRSLISYSSYRYSIVLIWSAGSGASMGQGVSN